MNSTLRKGAALLAVLIVILGLCVPSSASAANVITTHAYNGNTDPEQTVDVSYDPAEENQPWIVVLHGGSWAAGSKANTASAAKYFRSQGFVVFNVEYRKTTDYKGNPGVPWTVQRDDVLRGVKWAKANAEKFGAVPDRGAIYGFSAGGHLAMTAGLYDQITDVRAIVSVAGVLQPQRVYEVATSASGHGGDAPTSVNRALSQWESVAMRCPYLPTWADCAARWDNFMPQNLISANDPDVLMFSGEEDPAVPYQTGRSFKYWLDREGVLNRLIEVSGEGHTDKLAFDGGARQAAMLKFLKEKTA